MLARFCWGVTISLITSILMSAMVGLLSPLVDRAIFVDCYRHRVLVGSNTGRST
jgi:hypothetical protein